jgi:molecular chaperone DnaJ
VKRDYYEVLGVTKEASLEDLTRAFHKAAKKFHPDLNPGHAQDFKDANEAFETLSDPNKRALYNLGKNGGGYQGTTGGFDGVDDFFDGATATFGDFFDECEEQTPPKKGRAVRVKLTIDFLEAITGTVKTITVTRGKTCGACAGVGHAAISLSVLCGLCGGSGEEVLQDGFNQIRKDCVDCNGQGSKQSHPCGPCEGKGKVASKVKIEIRVPQGTAEGTRLRLTGQGEPGVAGGPDGDLICRVCVRKHPFFARKGNDVVLELAVPYSLAVLGGQVNVPTLTGRHVLSIPAGTQSGSFVRIVGGGVTGGTKVTGDQLVRVTVNVPKNLTGDQKALLSAYGTTDTAIVVGKVGT